MAERWAKCHNSELQGRPSEAGVVEKRRAEPKRKPRERATKENSAPETRTASKYFIDIAEVPAREMGT